MNYGTGNNFSFLGIGGLQDNPGGRAMMLP